MKKFAALLIALVLMLCSVSALAEIKLGQVEFAAHGTKCFAVITVAMDGDKIAAAYIEEFQVMSVEEATVVPNAENMWADQYAEGQALASKRVNNELYSNNMTTKAGATIALVDNYKAIEAFVTGKTIAKLEAEVEGKDAAAMVDAVSSCTLVDTLGYINGIIAAAKAAQ